MWKEMHVCVCMRACAYNVETKLGQKVYVASIRNKVYLARKSYVS